MGGKGANLAEMTKLGLPVPPGFTITTEACREYLALGERAERAAGAGDDGAASSGGQHRPPARRPARSAAGECPVRGEVLDARDDGDGAEHRSERCQRQGSGRGVAATSGSPGIPTGGCCRCSARRCWRCRARCSPMRWTRPRPTKGVTSDLDLDVDDLQGPGRRRSRTAIREHSGARVPAAPARATRHGDQRGLRLLEHRPGPAVPAPRAHPAGPGHRGQRLHHGVRQPRRHQRHRRGFHPRPGVRARPAPTATTCPTRRARTWSPASGTRCAWTIWPRSTRTSHQQLTKVMRRLETHYRDLCDIEFTIERGKLWMLQTRVGKRTAAAAFRIAGAAGRRAADHPGRGAGPGHRDASWRS